jgi:hypothetical protein
MRTRVNRRKVKRYLDRRSVEDRRKVYSLNYFLGGGMERRGIMGRRRTMDRRQQRVVQPIRRGPTLS